jgi:hypothetical protein
MMLGLSIVVLFVAAGCGMFGRGGKSQDRFVRPGAPRTSPTDSFVASVEEKDSAADSVKTWTVVVADKSGVEVFRDEYAYSTRHSLAVTWLSTKDQLWILSGDVGTAHIEAGPDGRWAKTSITPQTRGDIPQEISQLK